MSQGEAKSSGGKVSVLISTYNRSDHLARAIDSVLEQTYKDLEIIIADDGSTDDTAQVCSGYGDKIKYYYQENGGLGAARQFALSKATGEYLAWLDDDDLWTPEKLEKMVSYLESHPDYEWAHGEAVEIDGQGKTTHESYLAQFGDLKMEGDVYNQILYVCFPLTSTVMMKRSCLEKLGGFDVSEKYGTDVDLFLRASIYFKIGLLREPLVKRTLHPADFERANSIYDRYSVVSCRVSIFDRVLENNKDLTPDQRDATVAMRRVYSYRLAEIYWREYKLADSRKSFLESLELSRRSIKALAYIALSFLPVSAIKTLRGMRHGEASTPAQKRQAF